MSRKKLLMLLIIMAGCLMNAYLLYDIKANPYLLGNRSLKRNDYGNGDSSYILNLEYEDTKETVDIRLDERKYTEDELEVLRKEAVKALKEQVGTIKDDIRLPTSLEGYPFTFRWKSSDEEIMDSQGHLMCSADCRDSHNITLSLWLICDEYRAVEEIDVIVYPRVLDARKLFLNQLLESISLAEEKSKTEEFLYLPEQYQGIKLSWSEPVPMQIFMILPGSIVMALVVGWAFDRDEKAKQNRIKEALEIEYPFFIEKLKLYILSGMTVKKAFCQIAKESNDKNSINKVLSDELQIVVNRFSNGVREEDVYRDFGSRCGGSYKRLALLLMVNLKKGNDRLMSLIDEEVVKAQNMRKEMILLKSDQAGVKMLFPMIVMLMVVMLLIMIPAYFGIGY